MKNSNFKANNGRLTKQERKAIKQQRVNRQSRNDYKIAMLGTTIQA